MELQIAAPFTVKLSWSDIVEEFSLKYDDCFERKNTKAHFDYSKVIIDGARKRWKYILLLDAVLIIQLDRESSDHRNIRRQFEHCEVLQDIIKRQFVVSLNSSAIQSSTASQLPAPTVDLTVPYVWHDIAALKTSIIQNNSVVKGYEKWLSMIERLCTAQMFMQTKSLGLAVIPNVIVKSLTPGRFAVVTMEQMNVTIEDIICNIRNGANPLEALADVASLAVPNGTSAAIPTNSSPLHAASTSTNDAIISPNDNSLQTIQPDIILQHSTAICSLNSTSCDASITRKRTQQEISSGSTYSELGPDYCWNLLNSTLVNILTRIGSIETKMASFQQQLPVNGHADPPSIRAENRKCVPLASKMDREKPHLHTRSFVIQDGAANAGEWCEAGRLVSISANNKIEIISSTTAVVALVTNQFDNDSLHGMSTCSSSASCCAVERNFTVNCAISGWFPVILSTDQLEQFREGTFDVYLCVDVHGCVKIWDFQSQFVRIFGQALRQETSFDAGGNLQPYQGVLGVVTLLSREVECHALHVLSFNSIEVLGY